MEPFGDQWLQFPSNLGPFWSNLVCSDHYRFSHLDVANMPRPPVASRSHALQRSRPCGVSRSVARPARAAAHPEGRSHWKLLRTYPSLFKPKERSDSRAAAEASRGRCGLWDRRSTSGSYRGSATDAQLALAFRARSHDWSCDTLVRVLRSVPARGRR